MATPELLAAVTAAVKGESPPADPPVVDPPAGDPLAGDPPAGDPLAGDPPAAAREDLIGTPPAGDPPVLDADGRMRGPDGKFVAATPKPGEATPPSAAAPAAAPPATPPAAAAPAVPPKAADPVNDPVPPNAKPETRERITTLAGMVKERDTKLETVTAEAAAVREDLEALMAPITESGASIEQFRESMNLVKLLNSPHQHEQMQALQYLQGAAATLAERLGQVVPGTDPLEGFPDLQAQVRANPALRPMAEQAAQGIRFQRATQQHHRTTQQQTEQQRLHQQAAQQGQAAVREVEATLQATDPQYLAKIAVLRADTAFTNQLRSLPPTQWAQKFAEKYRTVKVAVSPTPTPTPSPTPSPSPAPLRAKTPAGAQGRPPANSLEAVRAAVSSVGAGR